MIPNDNLNISTTSHSNTDNNNTGEDSPGRKSPSISAAIAIFGGGNIKNKPSTNINQHTQKQQQPIISKPKPWQRPSQVANNDDNDIISDSSILDANHQSPAGKNKLPIINVLEVENELRKREDEGFVLDKVCEEQEQDTKETMVDDDGEEEEMMILDNNRQQKQGEDGDSTIMDMSDSEAGASQFEPEEEEVEEEPEWEDFMANYWKLSSATTETNLSIAIKEEDTDLKPCLIDPTLDVDEPLASSHTGYSIDIDMDCDDAKILSNVGLNCSIAMSRLTQDNKDGNSMESLRIDISRVERKKVMKNYGKEKVPEKEETRPIPQSRVGLEPPDESHSPPSAFFNPHTHHQTKTKTANITSPSQSQLAQQEMMNIPTPTKSFDNDTAAAVSTVGSDVASSAAGSHSWKHNIDKSSPLPIAELIHGTGSISTRTSLRALVMKKWHPSYWMHYGPHTLLIFRSKEHMDDWATNPYHSSKQREFLVKLEINFKVDMESNDGKDAGILGHRLLPMKQKSYGKKDEDEMFQFKLERWTNLGCSVLAAFASHEEAEVQVLYNTICDILKTCPNNGLKDISHMLK